MFCQTCGSEYLEGISRCAECDVELVAELPTPDHSGQPLKLVRVCGATDAEMIQELLKNNGIDVVLQGERTALTLPAAGELTEVRVWVQETDVAKAEQLIQAFFESADAAIPSDPDDDQDTGGGGPA